MVVEGYIRLYEEKGTHPFTHSAYIYPLASTALNLAPMEDATLLGVFPVKLTVENGKLVFLND